MTERLLPFPDERWRVCAEVGCEQPERIYLRNGFFSLRLWLQQVKADKVKLLEMRSVLAQGFQPWPVCQLSDSKILQRVLDLLESNRIHLHAAPAAPLADAAWGSETDSDDDSSSNGTSLPQSSSYSAPVAEPPTFPPNADGAAQAAALIAAAQSGVPFCAQCAAAAKASANK